MPVTSRQLCVRRTRLFLLPLTFTLVMLFPFSAPAWARQQPPPGTARGERESSRLEPGKAVEREIAGGESQGYLVRLAAGEFLRVVAEQKGIDVALALAGPDGRQLIESNLTALKGTREPLSFEAKVVGDYRLTVRANGQAAQRGAYRLLAEVKPSADERDRKRMAAEQLLTETRMIIDRKDFRQGVEKGEQALAIYRELGDREWEGHALGAVADAYRHLSRFDKYAESYEQILEISREIKNRTGEASALSELGSAYQSLGRHEKSLEYFEQALALYRELKDRRQEGVTLADIGWENQALRRFDKAIESCEQALAVAREVKSRYDEGNALSVLGVVYLGLRQFEKAVEYQEQFLAIERELKDREGEAGALNNLASSYRTLLRFEKAVEYFEQALAIYRELKDRHAEALVLRNLGDTYSQITRLDKAVENYELALPIFREIGDRQGEAFVLGPLANVYYLLGRPEKSIEYFELALPINREFKNYMRVSNNLNGLGNAYNALGKYGKAVELYEQGLAVARENRLPFMEGTILGNMADEYILLGDYDKALDYAQQALPVARQFRMRGSEATLLNVLGGAFHAKGQYTQAVSYHGQALRTAREIKARSTEGIVLHGLMLDWQAQRRPDLAVFFGKQAVNLYQEIRGEIAKLDRESQQDFVKSREDTYRTLADLLISAGRLPEAEQVISMLKQDEYFDFIRRDTSAAPDASRARMTPEEEALEKRYREISEQIAELGAERGLLAGKSARTPEEEQRLAKLDADLSAAGDAFQKFLDRLTEELGGSKEGSAKVFQLRESQGMMEDLRELGAGTVALHTLVADDKYLVILTTPDFQKGYEYPVKAADLNRKVSEFRAALQNPKLDPLPPAQELYRILVGPVAKDLERAKAKTIMWSLDGVLRYVPVAALHDGSRYLVERYDNVVFTPASQARLKDAPAEHWDVLGLGVTKGRSGGIPALPGVAEEMRGIVRDASAGEPSASGVLPGVVKLDEQFTQEAMLAELRRRRKVVHIASHFMFTPGDETNSALLLGDGQFLSLAQIKSLPNVFGGVDLLTLSACNTATGGSANGKEVEGFAVLAQRQGAKAVVASLWPVADRSTTLLMKEFYRLRESQVGTSKAEALRQAQLELLRGGGAERDRANGDDRGLAVTELGSTAQGGGTFTRDPKAPFAHPFFWAPFIMIGNWK